MGGVVFNDVGAEAAADVHAVTQAAYGVGPPLDPPSGAISETVDLVAADLAEHGGVLGLDDRVPVAALRYRRVGRTTTVRRVGVVPDRWRHGLGGRLVTHAHAAVARRGDVARLHVNVRHARPGARRFWLSLGYAPTVRHDHWDEMERPVPYAGSVPTADDMRTLGRRLAPMLDAGDLVVAIGPLGAGKTTLTQGVAEGLGVRGAVTSPTFVLAREHVAAVGGVPLVHVDAYRLGNVADPLGEIDALDLDATLDDAVTVVEWGEGLVERLTDNRVEVRIDLSGDGADDARSVVVDPLGPRWAGMDVAALLNR